MLLDLIMPVMDGWTFLHECLSVPWCKEIPIVVLSAAYGLQKARDEFGTKVRATLGKPFDLSILLKSSTPSRGTLLPVEMGDAATRPPVDSVHLDVQMRRPTRNARHSGAHDFASHSGNRYDWIHGSRRRTCAPCQIPGRVAAPRTSATSDAYPTTSRAPRIREWSRLEPLRKTRPSSS